MISSEINYFTENLIFNQFEFRLFNGKNRNDMYKLFDVPKEIIHKVEYLGSLIKINIFQLHWTLSINKDEIFFVQNDVKHNIDLTSRGNVLEILLMNGYISNAQLNEINPNLVDFLLMNGFTKNFDNSFSNLNYTNKIKINSNLTEYIEIEIV